MTNFDKKLEELGGLEILNKFIQDRDDDFDVEAYCNKDNIFLSKEYIAFSKKYGFHQFNNDVVFTSMDKLPITGTDNLCPIDFIYGWGKGSNSLQEVRKVFLEQIPENLFVFAEGNAGDQICINIIDHSIYYWHHESPEGKDIFMISKNFTDFIMGLKVNMEDDEDDSDLEEEWLSDDF